jgi:diguanylate cyclase (GGDEF)-like protein/PAS domain S-box-containing protein
MENSDLVLEAPAAPPTAAERTPTAPAKANLAALSALLNLDDEDRSCAGLFGALHAAFVFDRALALQDTDEGVSCLAAEAAELAGRNWPDRSLHDAFDVYARPAAGPAQAAPAFQDLLAQLAAADEPVLSMPFALNGRRALLVLLRSSGTDSFSDDDVALARQCAAVALATLVARRGTALEAENRRLKERIEGDAADGPNPPQSSQLLARIVDELPLSLTVQDDSGRFILVNAMAAADLAMPAADLIGASPADFLPAAEAASRREWEQSLLSANEPVIVETNVSDRHGEHSWMSSHKPVRILDRTFLISSSIDITERKQVERELVQQSHIDQLTGLPDRILIQQHVEAIIGNDGASRRFALAFIDLDNFKHINDYYNHAIGDGLLVKIGERITSLLRPGDIIARISGDEFLLLLDPCDGEDEIRPLVDRILQSLKQPFHIEAFEVFSSCSIGISLYPEHGRDYETLRRNADSAMYRAKQEAKGGAIFFDLDMAQAVAARMAAEQRLRLAIRDRKFCCAFQPKIDIHSEQVVGFEALVRWRDEDGEIQPPGEFIGLAVELGLIDPITNFVLHEAVESIDRLDAAFGSDTTISVNVAAKQANDLEFMHSFAQAIRDSNRAERIIVELTEDAFIAKGAFQAQVLPLLREIGVRISIDDFGTGYSSLGTLADITADELKIDRSFISGIDQRPRNQSVLRAIESLGRALGMSIIAEGVETYEELAYLRAATRIRYVQGFYFAKPFYLDDANATADYMNRGREAARGAAPDRASGARLAVAARSAD